MDAVQIKTPGDPFAPYNISQGFKAGEFIFLSGQAAIDDEGLIVGSGDFQAQAEQTVDNINTLLKRAGSDLSRVVKVTIYLTDMKHFPDIVELRAKHFTRPYPADTIVEVSSLALPELMIEIDVIALANGSLIAAD
jgi:2-iminobutanoate/2-iminopropanoate deaminase